MMVRELFEQAIGDAPPPGIDLDRVVRRQRRAARLRSGAAALAAVAVLAVAAGLVTQVGGEETTTPALELRPGLDPLAGFPEYLQGTRVVAATTAPLREPLTLTFTPATLDLVLFLRCEGHGLEPGYELRAVVSADGLIDNGVSCGEPAPLAMTGIAAREPVTITAALTTARHAVSGGAPELDVPDQGNFGMAVAEVVPFEEYPLPAAPERLTPLPEPEATDTVVRADPADPAAPVEVTFRWDASLGGCDPADGRIFPLELVSQTPGILRVLVGDVEVTEQTWWDYQQESRLAELTPACGEIADGDEVTLRVEPEHVTGDWQVVLNGAGG